MTQPVSLTNFAVSNLPPNTEDFYNTPAFAQGEIQFLSTAISIMNQGLEAGLQAIQNATDGLT